MQEWPFPKLIAHRGGGRHAPENTLAAMRVGEAFGYRAVEFDVKLSADRVPFLLHDETLARTTSGEGRAADFEWAELAALDAGAWHSEAFRGEPLARYDVVAEFLQQRDLRANVEIKPAEGEDEVTGRVVAEQTAALFESAAAKPLLSSFSFTALAAARIAASHLPRGMLWEKLPDNWRDVARELSCVSIHLSHRYLARESVAAMRAQGYRVMVYTVNELARMRELIEWGVDGLFTDELQAAARAFPEWLR